MTARGLSGFLKILSRNNVFCWLQHFFAIRIRAGTKISMIYINDIYDSIIIFFSSEKYHDIFKISTFIIIIY